jgi:hypothetical protein
MCGHQVSYTHVSGCEVAKSKHSPRPDQLGNSEQHAENDAEPTDGNIGNTQERVLSANH